MSVSVVSGLTPVTATAPDALTAAAPDVAEALHVNKESKFEIVAVSPLVLVTRPVVTGMSAAFNALPDEYAVPSE